MIVRVVSVIDMLGTDVVKCLDFKGYSTSGLFVGVLSVFSFMFVSSFSEAAFSLLSLSIILKRPKDGFVSTGAFFTGSSSILRPS